MIMLLKFGYLFLGLYSCRNKAASGSTFPAQGAVCVIDATTLLELQDVCVGRRRQVTQAPTDPLA